MTLQKEIQSCNKKIFFKKRKFPALILAVSVWNTLIGLKFWCSQSEWHKGTPIAFFIKELGIVQMYLACEFMKANPS